MSNIVTFRNVMAEQELTFSDLSVDRYSQTSTYYNMANHLSLNARDALETYAMQQALFEKGMISQEELENSRAETERRLQYLISETKQIYDIAQIKWYATLNEITIFEGEPQTDISQEPYLYDVNDATFYFDLPQNLEDGDGQSVDEWGNPIVEYNAEPIFGGRLSYGFAFDQASIEAKNRSFLAIRATAYDTAIPIFFSFGSIALSVVYLIFAAGKKPSSPNKIHLSKIDWLFSEITLGLLIVTGLGVLWYGDRSQLLLGFSENSTIINLTILTVVACTLLFVVFLLSLVRHIKNHTLVKNSLIAKISLFVYGGCKKAFDSGPPMKKALFLVIGLGIFPILALGPIVAIILGQYFLILLIFTLIPLAFAIRFTYRQVQKYLAIKEGVTIIKSGNYSQPIDLTGNGELAKLAEDINEISSGLSNEVERRLKSERLKTELIVNVSHDIKTPLTSVITYVDLLQKENIQNQEAQKYIQVIAAKSNRLKQLIDDLFEASKAASGNITVNYANVDINELITQGMGEMDDKIKDSGLDFRTSLPAEKLIAYGDGRLLWRVLENLLSNVFKYSLPHSRVYLTVTQDNDNAYIELKNISATELNIPEDELTERFKRGDESRHSEGNGLGLDIAKSLMACQHGELKIKIDGDLFKVTVSIPKVSTN
jgi:signal transduction histidine kinase